MGLASRHSSGGDLNCRPQEKIASLPCRLQERADIPLPHPRAELMAGRDVGTCLA
jgi:hypothetical protein